MASSLSAMTKTALPETESLKFLSSGKVRDLYRVKDTSESGQDEYLLFVATDRISAFDVILNNGVPGKGKLLTQISVFWFEKLKRIIDNHVVASSLEAMPQGIRDQIAPHWNSLEGRTMLVRKAKVVKLEAIVRGYVTGSAWSEYKQTKTIHGIRLPEHYVESSKLEEPLFTPSTKADLGEHDENISPERAEELLGKELYTHVSRTAIALYKEASEYALARGFILADTKFEFGLVPVHPSDSETPPSPVISIDSAPHKLILVDEALTPDSSRYWSTEAYKPGGPQASFDKQFLRDWLLTEGFRKGLENGPPGREGEGWSMTSEVLEGTRERYAQVVSLLMGSNS